MPHPRETRLHEEFERIQPLVTPHSLVRVLCAPLTAQEGAEFQRPRMSFEVIKQHLPGFLEPQAFAQQYPGVAPEKYFVCYLCKGLVAIPRGGPLGPAIVPSEMHWMEMVCGWDYPTKPPTFIWWTPIWHPNFRFPHICIYGRVYTPGVHLDHVITEIGRMVQYQSYNLADPYDLDAAKWAREHESLLPIDDRDLLDRRHKITTMTPNVAPTAQTGDLVALISAADVADREGEDSASDAAHGPLVLPADEDEPAPESE